MYIYVYNRIYVYSRKKDSVKQPSSRFGHYSRGDSDVIIAPDLDIIVEEIVTT